MMYQVIWIVGEKALYEFCLKAFREQPIFVETVGHCGPATIWIKDKLDTSGSVCHRCYLAFMQHQRGDRSYHDIQQISHETYEQIISHRTTIGRI